MRIYRTPPKNLSFFNNYCSLLGNIRLIGIFAQLISASTGLSILYIISHNVTSTIIPSPLSHIISLICAIITALTIEYSLHLLVPYCTQAILHKRIKGVDLAMTITIYTATVIIITISGLVSFQGSKRLIKYAYPEKQIDIDIDEDSIHKEKIKVIEEKFHQDSIFISKKNDEMMKALKDKYESQVKYALSIDKTNLDKKIKIGEINIEKNQEYAELTSEKIKELSLINRKREKDREQVIKIYETAKNEAKNKNIKNAENVAATMNRLGNNIGLITIACLIIFTACSIIEQLFIYGSGISTMVVYSPYYLLPTIYEELRTATYNRLNHFFRSKLLPQVTTTNSKRSYQTVNVGEAYYRQCNHCGIAIKDKHGNARYCGSACRISQWTKEQKRKKENESRTYTKKNVKRQKGKTHLGGNAKPTRISTLA